MTDHQQPDKDLDDYLHGKSILSDNYQQLPADEPDAKTDIAILAAARRATSGKSRRLAWTIPAAVAAILLVGVSLVWWQQEQTSIPINYKESAAPGQEGTLPNQIDRTLHDNPAADQWLERILKLHNAGKTDQAEAEFKKFREAYPTYSLDPRRFGDLQQYDQ